ncbi:hypothetical protein GCM10027262_54760 [Nocardia tengchongensis]
MLLDAGDVAEADVDVPDFLGIDVVLYSVDGRGDHRCLLVAAHAYPIGRPGRGPAVLFVLITIRRGATRADLNAFVTVHKRSVPVLPHCHWPAPGFVRSAGTAPGPRRPDDVRVRGGS